MKFQVSATAERAVHPLALLQDDDFDSALHRLPRHMSKKRKLIAIAGW
jgi:hypothetical protein